MTRNFHPDFASPREDAGHPTVVQSSDDVFFHYDLSLLAAKSEFFADMQSIPSRETDTANVVPITQASAPALAFILHALAWEPKPKGSATSPPSAEPKETAKAMSPTRKAQLLPIAPATPPPTTYSQLPQPDSPSPPNPTIEPTDDQVVNYPSLSCPPTPSPSEKTAAPISYKDRSDPPPAIQRSSSDDSGTAIIEEIIDTANCYGINCLYDSLYASLVHYRWNPSIIFAVSVLLERGNAQYWSQRLVAAGQQGLHPWAVRRLIEDAPKVYDALLNLFRRWRPAFWRFKRLASTTFLVDGNCDFSARCRPPDVTRPAKEPRQDLIQVGPCAVYWAYAGDFNKFYAAILEQIFVFATEQPGLVGAKWSLERFCANNVPCRICAHRVAASARSAWLRTMSHHDWSLDTKHGASGPWKGGKKQKQEARKGRR